MSPTRRSFLTGAAAIVATPRATLSRNAAASVDGIAIVPDPDDEPFDFWDSQGNEIVTTFREIDQEAFDALDRVTGATFQVTFEYDGGKRGRIEFELRDGAPATWWSLRESIRPVEMNRPASLHSLPKWMWKQIGYEVAMTAEPPV